MRNKKNTLSILILGIILTTTASQTRAFIGFGIGGRRGGVSVGVGTPYTYDDYVCDDYGDCYYPGYYGRRHWRRGYYRPYGRRHYRRGFHHRRGRHRGHAVRGRGRGGRGRRK